MEGIDELWPDAAKKTSMSKKIVSRMQSWKQLLDSLHEFFTAFSEAENAFADSLRKIGNAMKLPSSLEGNLSRGVEMTKEIAINLSQSHTKNSFNIKHELIRRLDSIISEYSTVHVPMTEEVLRLEQSLKSLRQSVLLLTKDYEKACWSSKIPNEHPSKDPWVVENELRERMEKLQAVERVYQTTMKKFHEEFEKVDTYLTENLKEIILRFNSNIDKDKESRNELSEAINTILNSIEPSGEFNSFIEKNHIGSKEVWSIDIMPIRYPNQNMSRVIKESVMNRKGGLIKHTWKNSKFVLTDGGFLHCFDVGNETKPEISIFLRGCTIKVRSDNPQTNESVFEENSCIFEILSKNRNSVLVAKASCEDELEEWVSEITSYCTTDDENNDHAVRDFNEFELDGFVVLNKK